MKNKTFHGILLDNLLDFGSNIHPTIEKHRGMIWELMEAGMRDGVVKPIHRTIFAADKAEEAFRYIASGKHIGKVVLKIRDEELPDENGCLEVQPPLELPSIPRTVFYRHKSYIITGGLGGFGLELIDWMISREARHFVVTSRSGVKDFYQKTRLNHFASKGAVVRVFTQDTITEEGAEALIDDAESLGPLGGVFHLAMVLSDGLFDNQTLKSFQNVLNPKSTVFTHLDKITRARCPHTDYFVAFSSVSCGLGNPGQTNYGYANSVMERICERRRKDGLHGFAIQWGAIGDVGYIIDNVRGNEIVVCGSVPQRMPCCLASLDRLLQSEYAVCSNLIKSDYILDAGCGKTSLMKTVAHILGVRDHEKLEPHVTLGELGMDSLMGVEVKQAIERDYDVVLSMQDVRKLTIGRIREIEKSGKPKSDGQGGEKSLADSIDEKFLPSKPVIYLNEIMNGDPIIFLPQLDGDYKLLIDLSKKLNRPAVGLNWTRDCSDLETVQDTADHFIKVIEAAFPSLTTNYDLVGYSYGGIIATEMGIRLQNRSTGKLGLFRKLVLLDSSPKQYKLFIYAAINKHMRKVEDLFIGNDYVESTALFMINNLPLEYEKVKGDLAKLDSVEKRLVYAQEGFKTHLHIEVKTDTLGLLINSYYNKLYMTTHYEIKQKLAMDVMLIRATDTLIATADVTDDYCMDDVSKNLYINTHFTKSILSFSLSPGYRWQMSSAHSQRKSQNISLGQQ